MNKSKYMRSIIFFGLAVFACAASFADAADYVWAPYPAGIGGPWGGAARKIVSADGKLWAATSGGVFYSVDGGDTWQEKNTGLTHVNVTDLDVCIPADSNIPTLLATTMIDGFHNSSDLVFISSDGGDNWQSYPNTAWAGKDMWRAALDPTDASCGHMFVSSSSDSSYSEWMLFESSNGGISWKTVRYAAVTRMAFSLDGTLFFSTTAPPNVYSCAGANCSPAIVKSFSQSSVADMAIGGPAGQEIIVASADTEGLYFSGDSGVNWTQLYNPYTTNNFAYMQEVAVDPLDPTRIVFSVLNEFDEIYSINIDNPTLIDGPYGPAGAAVSHIYLTNDAEWLCDETTGIFRRKNGEVDFSLSNAGITAASVLDFDFSSDDSSVMAVGWKGGLSLWDPVSESWTMPDRCLLPTGTDCLPANITVELVKHYGNTVWAGVNGQGLHASFDGGLSWQKRFNGVSVSAGKHVESLVVMQTDQNLGLAATSAGIYSTEDGGVTWIIDPQINDKFGWQVASDAQGRLYAGNREGQQGLFFFKENWSDQWTSRGVDYFSVYGTQILSLEPSLSVDGRLLAGTFSRGILESQDYGVTWSSIGDGVLAASATNGVNITKIALANIPGINNRFAAVVKNTREVYATVDGGVSWFQIMGGLQLLNEPMPYVETLSFVPGTTRLVAGLSNRGLWYVDLIFFGINPVTSPTKNDSQTISGVCNTGQTVDVSVSPSNASHQVICQNEIWSVDIVTLQEGENTITASMDDNGAISTIVAKIIMDTTPPAAVTFDGIISPSNLTTQTISGVKEAGTTISAVVDPPAGSISISAPAASETWQIEIVGLVEGVNILTVTAEDEVGLFSPGADLDIEVDTTPPVFTVDETVILTQNSSCSISGQLDDGNATVSFLPEAGISGFLYNPGSGSWSATAVNLIEDEQIIAAVATDQVGNSSDTVEIHITMDTTPPAFGVDQTEITAQSRTQTISGTVEEGAEVIVDLGKSTATADAVVYGPAPGTWSVVLKDLEDAVHEIYFSAIDAAQNSTELITATITVALGDTTPPDFSVDQTYIENNLIRNQLITGTIEAEATVALISLGDLGATSNPVEYDRNAGTWSVLIKNLQNGAHVITAQATDIVGNVTEPVEITISVAILDEDPPDLIVDNKNILTTSNSWTISGTVSLDNGGSCETVLLTVDQGVAAGEVQYFDETSQWEVLVSNLSLGENIIMVQAVDEFDNFSPSIKVTVYVIDLGQLETNDKFTKIITGTWQVGFYVSVLPKDENSAAVIGDVEYDLDAGTWSVQVKNLETGDNVFKVVVSDSPDGNGNETDPMEVTVKVPSGSSGGGGGGGGCFVRSLLGF